MVNGALVAAGCSSGVSARFQEVHVMEAIFEVLFRAVFAMFGGNVRDVI